MGRTALRVRRDPSIGRCSGERGSGLVMALFVLVLLTGMGVVLLSVAQTESKMNKVDHQSKKAFYLAEAAIEQGRETLRLNNIASNNISLNGELTTAAGANGTINVDPDAIRPTYDSSGNITGFTGAGDDAPLNSLTSLGVGKYVSYLSNDAVDGRTSTSDSNNRVAIVGVAAGADKSFSVVETVVETGSAFPAFPATITILGSSPSFSGGNSNAKTLSGDDCGGAGVPGLSVPVVGGIGSAAVTA
jgi:Tfp pilus assembly protein PilX